MYRPITDLARIAYVVSHPYSNITDLAEIA